MTRRTSVLRRSGCGLRCRDWRSSVNHHLFRQFNFSTTVMSSDDLRAKLLYCQSMVHLAEHQVVEWRNILNQLERMSCSENRDKDRNIERLSMPPREPPRVAPEQNAADRAARERDERAQAQLGIRVGHLIRGLVLIYALSLPRMFYYVFAGYSLLLMSGLLDHLQQLPLRRLLGGARPSLDLQLTRLRQRQEFIEKLSRLDESPMDEEEQRKMHEFLSQFDNPRAPFSHRFVYQLFVMFFYSAFPACHPHSEYLT